MKSHYSTHFARFQQQKDRLCVILPVIRGEHTACRSLAPLAAPSPGRTYPFNTVRRSDGAIPCRYDSIFCCMSSSVMPAVSGNSRQTTKNWTTVITAKRTNGAGRERGATVGKVKAMMAFMIQWVKLPRLWPLARTRLGNISLRKTQMTEPCGKANKAIKPI